MTLSDCLHTTICSAVNATLLDVLPDSPEIIGNSGFAA